jgi:polysaccharide biosynthesis/export protein
MREQITLLLLAGVLAMGGWAQTNDGKPEPGKDTGVTPDASVPQQRPSSAADSPYVIGPDDTLHINVWKEPDLTNTLPVRPDGMISLPLLNDVQAAGLTPMQLAVSITEKLKKYVAHPHVTVVVTAMNSQRVFVLGEVQHTGTMPLTPGMTVLQALASAGLTQFANTKGIYVLRVQNGKQQKIAFNYKGVVKGESMAQNVVLKPGDTVVVP